VLTLVALRLVIGWHFYKEGITKIHDPGWTAVGFLAGAKGPLSPYFELMVWDIDGRARLNFARSSTGRPTIKLDNTLQAWRQYRARVADHYGFDAAQKKDAARCLAQWEGRLRWYFDQNREEIIKYFEGLDRRDANRGDASHQGVESLRGQAEQIEKELKKARAPWLADVGKLWAGYDAALNAIATRAQLAQRGDLRLEKPGSQLLDTNTIDPIIPYFDTALGVLLILGLFTRLASLAGAAFLFSICLTQWPGTPGAAPIYYQAIEMVAMLVLAAIGAGQFAGLDFVIRNVRTRTRTPKQETE